MTPAQVTGDSSARVRVRHDKVPRRTFRFRGALKFDGACCHTGFVVDMYFKDNTTGSSVNKTHTQFYGIKRRQVKHKIYIYFIFMSLRGAIESNLQCKWRLRRVCLVWLPNLAMRESRSSYLTSGEVPSRVAQLADTLGRKYGRKKSFYSVSKEFVLFAL